MFTKIKSALGLIPSWEQWYEMKTEAMVTLLGEEHNLVSHAIIPFSVGGALDLYFFPQSRGYAIGTKELIERDGSGPRNARYSAYELCLFSPDPVDSDRTNGDTTPIGQRYRRYVRMLNMLARYCSEATLNPNETMEFPAGMERVGGHCLILDAITKNGQSLNFNKHEYGLMLAINIHRSEMEFARANGGQKLIEKLKAAQVYPYSDLDRRAVA